jgi:hypothetical protein
VGGPIHNLDEVEMTQDYDSEPHVVLARDWEGAAKYLRSSPLVVANTAFCFFLHACDAAGADYLQTFKDMLVLNDFYQPRPPREPA